MGRRSLQGDVLAGDQSHRLAAAAAGKDRDAAAPSADAAGNGRLPSAPLYGQRYSIAPPRLALPPAGMKSSAYLYTHCHTLL